MCEDTQQKPTAPMVSVKMHQAYDLNLTVNFVPARVIPGVIELGCQSRQGTQRLGKHPLDLPESTRKLLLDANEKVIAWLSQDVKNQYAFLTDPIAALQEAGVAMDRTQAKGLARMRENLGMAQAVVPGLQFRSIHTKVSKTGRVKPVDNRGSNWVPPKLQEDNNNCDCDNKKGED